MNIKVTRRFSPGVAIMTIAIAAASVLAGCSHGISKGQLADAINEKLGEKKVCFAPEEKKMPAWPLRLDMEGMISDKPLDPILAEMQAAGYLHITQEPERYMFGGSQPALRDVDVITPTEEVKGWWNVPDGFCVGTKGVADIQEWTLPGKDSGAPAQMTEVKYTWHLTDVPKWAQRPEFKNIEGMATPVQDTAVLQMTNNGWKTE